MLDLLPAPRAAALAEGPVTIDLDATDVEVYGRRKRGVAYPFPAQFAAQYPSAGRACRWREHRICSHLLAA
jgi:hypothetical protein